MANNAIIIGVLLILLGVGFYAASGANSWTALLPAILGALLLACGLAARQKESWRKHAMHVAAAVALLGALGSLGRAVPALLGGTGSTLAITEQLIAAGLMLVFVALAVQSFIAARRERV